MTKSHKLLPVLACAALLSGLAHRRVDSGQPTLIIKPFLLHEVRELVCVDSQVLVYNPAERGESITLDRLEVRADGVLIERIVLGSTLPGDREYGETQALIERLPHEIAHRHDEDRFFASPDAPEFEGTEAVAAMHEVQRSVAAMGDRYTLEGGQPFEHLNFILPTDQVFFPNDMPGTQAQIQVSVYWTSPDGHQHVSQVEHPLTWRGQAPTLPESFKTANSSASVHRGDLHVHTCHGEALGACSPSANCYAETLQVSGSFSLDQLKSQYQALGMDWFTATDHSYCINSDAEYDVITAEAAAITDGSFVCISDTELSSDEEGPQEGSDGGDGICLWGTEANHMGAHALKQRIYGGDDALFGFCDGLFSDVLNGFVQNIATIRSVGGYPIAHHPAGGTFSWESRQYAVGMEANGLHGVEIWNGSTQTGQGGHVQDWVDWLLGGRLLYCYSGSDTHDQAFGFGSNHVIVDGALTVASLEAGIRAGAVYVSNGPALVLETDLGGATLPMGSLHTLPNPIPAAVTTVRAHYDFGAGSGTVTLFRGVAGDASESVIFTSGTLTGSGFVETFDALDQSGNHSWYRAYAENSGASQAAYSNPVFFVPGSGSTYSYCTAKPSSRGCVPTISGAGVPSMTPGVPFHIQASQVHNSQFGILVYSHGPDFNAFFGGTLCVDFPLRRVTVQTTGGNSSGQDCSGALSFDFNTWIALGKDAGIVAGETLFAQWWYRDGQDAFGAGLTDALQFTVQP